jgi:His-Xaa-Ser system protein HxsD
MTNPLAQVPRGMVEVDLSEGTAIVHVDESLYPLPAVQAAAYAFIDRGYVLLDRPAPERLRVCIALKAPPADPEALPALVGELANELLASAFRQQLAQDNRVLVEAVTMQAMAGAMGAPSLTDLADFDFTDDALDDPLGIAQSWEEKHGRTLGTAARPPEPEPEPEEAP